MWRGGTREKRAEFKRHKNRNNGYGRSNTGLGTGKEVREGGSGKKN